MAIENLTATTLRNIIGDMELDETLTSREVINTKMRAALDIATDPWGIKVNRVELKNIMPPAAIQEAMEKQMKAEAILKVQQANADGIRFLKEAGADESVLTLKSLEALKDMAEGKATKIIVPSDLQGLAGLATSLKEIMTDKNIEKK